MKLRDLHILPQLRDSLSYLYVERAVIQRYRQSVEYVDENGRVAIPIASLSVLLLGPGTSISHEAIKLLAQNGCSVIWTGEEGSLFYAQGSGETRKGYRLLRQAALASDPVQRRAVARRMFARRLNEVLDPDVTMEQLRGMEGVRMRNAYRHISRRYGVQWRGRRYDRNRWNASDPTNRALSAANALLNGICHAAIVSGGYSPGLGFIHTGKQLSFVYDIADLYKIEISIPIAFQVVALNKRNVEMEVRRRCREKFREVKLLERILPDIDALLELTEEPGPDYDSDGALPGPLINELNNDEMDEDG
jgi:CRISPR-associated protein Cas1